MARVVQRRTSPPYLLILFVFLFLIATAAAIMFFVGRDTAVKGKAQAEDKLAQYVSTADENDADVQAKIKEAASSSPRQSVVGLYRKMIPELASFVVVNPPDDPGRAYAAAKAEADRINKELSADETTKTLYAYKGLAAIQTALENLRKNDEAMNGLKADLKKKQDEKEALSKDMSDAAKKQTEALTKLSDQIKAIDDKSKKDFEEYQANVDKVTKEFGAKADTYEKNVNDKLAQIAKLQGRIKQLEDENADVKNQLSVARNPGAGKVALKADGKVTDLAEVANQKFCYVNLGASDNVQVGMTLAVFPSAGIGIDAKPKARIRILNMLPTTSECTILEQDPKDPISKGDLVANLAYEKGRSQAFVVEGLFDLRGGGVATSAGTDEVKDMISKSGGKVEDSVTINTDYVVLGDQPSKPTKPAEGAAPTVEKVYREQLKIWEHYQEVQDQAKAMRIPILNTNRFLDLVGYAPAAQK